MQTLNREFSHKHVCCRITYTLYRANLAWWSNEQFHWNR